MITIADRLGEPTMRWVAAFEAGGCMALLRGDLAEVERCAKQALKIGSEAGEPDAFMIYGAQIGPVRLIQGRVSDVSRASAERAGKPAVASMEGFAGVDVVWLGRGDDAAAIVAEAAADSFEHVPWDPNRTSTLALYADAAAQAGAPTPRRSCTS